MQGSFPRMNERVDKKWREAGLSGYSTAAIFATLRECGIESDEVAFLALAAERTPGQVVQEWTPVFKGSGPFARYLPAAVDELMRRLLPARVTPALMAERARELLDVSAVKGDVAPALAAFEELRPGLPPSGPGRDAFCDEFSAALGKQWTVFHEAPVRLARAGRKDEALAFARFQEGLFWEHEGALVPLVRGLTGERDAAVAELSPRAQDASRTPFSRLVALQVLAQLDAFEPIRQHGFAVFDAAADGKSWDIAHRVAHVLVAVIDKGLGDAAFQEGLRTRLDRVHEHVHH